MFPGKVGISRKILSHSSKRRQEIDQMSQTCSLTLLSGVIKSNFVDEQSGMLDYAVGPITSTPSRELSSVSGQNMGMNVAWQGQQNVASAWHSSDGQQPYQQQQQNLSVFGQENSFSQGIFSPIQPSGSGLHGIVPINQQELPPQQSQQMQQQQQDLGGQTFGFVQPSSILSQVAEPMEIAAQQPMPLPFFSARIRSVLKERKILEDLNHFIEETAYHIMEHGDMIHKHQYFDFGRRMFLAYPCIEFQSGGQHPWSYFLKKLSQKLRNIRWARKERRGQFGQPTSMKNRRGRKILSNVLAEVEETGNTITDEEAVVQMKNEASKPSNKRDRALLAKLFVQTYVMRRSAIAKIADGHVQLIIEDFPLLGDIFFIHKEFDTLFKSNEQQLSNWTELMRKLAILYSNRTELEIIFELMSHLDKKHPASKANVLKPVVSLVQAKDLELSSDSRSPPRLILVEHLEEPHSSAEQVVTDFDAIIVADNTSVKCGRGTLEKCLINLLAAYYAWDLTFPTQYQMLGFLQKYFLADIEGAKEFAKSSKFCKFEKKFVESV